MQLYIYMGVACCGEPISSRVTLIGSPTLELQKNPPTYASVDDDITRFMMLESVSIALLELHVLLKICDIKKMPSV